MDDLRAGLAQGMPLLSRAVETLAEMGEADGALAVGAAPGAVDEGLLASYQFLRADCSSRSCEFQKSSLSSGF